MIPSEITVPAGETTTVEVGVPVDVNYSSGGWTVTSNGTSVSVTAPDQDGATASVPASAGGYSATVTLVAVGGGADTDAEKPAAEQNRSTGGDRNGESAPSNGENDDAGAGAGAVQRPERKQAEKADTENAKRLEFDGEIHGNEIVVKVPLRKAADLMQYASYDTSNATVRYVDVNGRIIEGVERDVDVKGRTLTLTYPEGETPDNPFIIEVVEDGAATFVAVITATNAEVERPENAGAEGDGYDGQVYEVDEGSSASGIAPLLIGGAALLAALALLIVFLRKRSRGRV